MSSTITRHITEADIPLDANLNAYQNLHLNWMDNTISINSDINGLEGNILGDNAHDQPSVVNVKNGSTMDELMGEWDTLDEPIVATLMRDIASIYAKLKFIIIPVSLSDSFRNVLKDWDLWGPLIVTTFLALTLHHNEETIGGTVLVGPHFAHIFVLIWFSNLVLSLNYKLLNSCRKRNVTDKSVTYSPTTFQLLCVFGYCLSPPCLGIIVLKVISIVMATQIKDLFYEKLIIGVILGFLWPTICSQRIIAKYICKEKRLLAVYPIALFYFVLSWALITTH